MLDEEYAMVETEQWPGFTDGPAEPHLGLSTDTPGAAKARSGSAFMLDEVCACLATELQPGFIDGRADPQQGLIGFFLHNLTSCHTTKLIGSPKILPVASI